MRNWLIKKLLENSPERQRILTEVVQELYNPIRAEDILQLKDDGSYTFGDKVLTPDQYAAIKREADIFKNSALYKVLDYDCKYRANRKMYIEATTIEQVESGKIMLYIWDVVKSRLNNF